MIDFLKLESERRRTAFEQAGLNAGLPANSIEKDWWVTLTLKALFAGAYAKFIIFKGGTSLSKCWNLIQRFSEDIDIALDSAAFGIAYVEEPDKKYIRQLKRRGCEFTTNELKADIEKQFDLMGIPAGICTVDAAPVKPNVPDTDPQILFVTYNSLFNPNPYLPSQVKIEASVRSLKEPNNVLPIQSLLTIYFPNKAVYPETPFQVTVVEPHRTFLEKAFLLHEEFRRPEKDKIKVERMSRHLYDLVRLMTEESCIQAIEDKELYNTIIKHRKFYSSLSWVDYATLGREFISFTLPAELLDAYKTDYAAMREAMIYGEAPGFEDLISRVNELNQRFRK